MKYQIAKLLIIITMISFMACNTVTYNIATIYENPNDSSNIALAPLLKEFNSGNGVLDNTFHNEESIYTYQIVEEYESAFPASTMSKYSYKYENRLYNHLEFSAQDLNRQEQIRKLSLVDAIIYVPQSFDATPYDGFLNYLKYLTNIKVIVLLNYFEGIEDLEQIIRDNYIEAFNDDVTMIGSIEELEGQRVYTNQTLSELLVMMNTFFHKNSNSINNTLKLDLGEQHLLNGRGLLASGIIRSGTLAVGDTVLGVLEGPYSTQKTIVTQIFINNVSVMSAKKDDYVSILMRGITSFYPGTTLTNGSFPDVNINFTRRVKFIGYVFTKEAGGISEPMFFLNNEEVNERPAQIIIGDLQVDGFVERASEQIIMPGDPIQAFAKFPLPYDFIFAGQPITIIIDNKLTVLGEVTIPNPSQY